ncbi:MAG: hypothetical protein ACOX61_06570 [Brooklawnia sp.]|jgi:hypothetical protein
MTQSVEQHQPRRVEVSADAIEGQSEIYNARLAFAERGYRDDGDAVATRLLPAKRARVEHSSAVNRAARSLVANQP